MSDLHTAGLRLSSSARVRRDQQSIIVEHSGGRVDCGPDGFILLDLLKEETTFAALGTALGARVATGTRWARSMAAARAMWQAGLLGEGAQVPTGDAAGFAGAPIHVAMLNDITRTTRFLEAIQATVRSGDVVVDVGTGTGVLAVAAARAGARHVYAIEMTTMADVAHAFVAANGLSDRITVVRGWSQHVTIPERARVVVSETLGHHPWGEDMLATLSDARRRFGTPDVVTIPSKVRLLAVPVTLPPAEYGRSRFTADAAARWSAAYGIDFGALAALQADTAGPLLVSAETARTLQAVCSPVLLDTVVGSKGHASPTRTTVTCVAATTGAVSGVLTFWEADLADGVVLSTHPDAAGPSPHWRLRVLPVAPGLQVHAGESFSLDLPLGATGRVRVVSGDR